MTTALVTHADCLEHVTPDGHPERVARLEHVLQALAGLELKRLTAPEVSDADLGRVHPQSHIDRLRKAVPSQRFHQIDGDTWMSPGTLRGARRAAGAVLCAVDAVMSEDVDNAFCAIRPPGHHCETETPMGFCLFGNVALGVKYALDHHGLQRVAVVDFDVHHGNGTQDLLWDEPRALTITSQQMPLWPGTGDPSERGAHDNVLNVPLSPGSDGATMRRAYEAQVFPRLRAFEPEMIFISAGFDAHQDDPLASLNWATSDFAWLTAQLCQIAAEVSSGRVVSSLEGGYDLAALAEAAQAHVEELRKAGA